MNVTEGQYECYKILFKSMTMIPSIYQLVEDIMTNFLYNSYELMLKEMETKHKLDKDKFISIFHAITNEDTESFEVNLKEELYKTLKNKTQNEEELEFLSEARFEEHFFALLFRDDYRQHIRNLKEKYMIILYVNYFGMQPLD